MILLLFSAINYSTSIYKFNADRPNRANDLGLRYRIQIYSFVKGKKRHL